MAVDLVTTIILTQVEEGGQAKIVQVMDEEMIMHTTKVVVIVVVEMDLVEMAEEVDEDQVEAELEMETVTVVDHPHILATTIMMDTVLIHLTTL